jgi:hypothetical protein
VAGRLNAGAEIKSTLLTAEFGLEEYSAQYAGRTLPLFAIDPAGRLQIYTDKSNFSVEAGWRVISLVDPKAKTEATLV